VTDAETGKEIDINDAGFDISILPEDTRVLRFERLE
jgi:hypothetical protein